MYTFRCVRKVWLYLSFFFLFIRWYCLFRFKLYLHPYIYVCTKLVASQVQKFIFILLSFTLRCVWKSSCVFFYVTSTLWVSSFVFPERLVKKPYFVSPFALVAHYPRLLVLLSKTDLIANKNACFVKSLVWVCFDLFICFGLAFASVLTLSFHRHPSEAWKQLSKCTALSEAKIQDCLPFRFQCSHIVCQKEQEGYVLKVCPIF